MSSKETMPILQQQGYAAPPPQQPVRVQPTGHNAMGTTQQSYAHENPLPAAKHKAYEAMITCLGDCNGCLGSLPFCCCCPNPFQTVPQGRVGLLTHFGKYFKTLDPGLFYVMPYTQQLLTVDMRMQIEDIPSQAIMTKDNVSIIIDSVLYWHVVNPYIATYMVANVRQALIERTMTTLRTTLGTRTVQDCIEHRESLAQEIEDIIAPVAKTWGISVESILIKDLRMSHELLESLSSAAKQKRIGEAKLIAAQAEVSAAKLMREASDILSTSSAMQMRYLDTLTTMSKAAGTKVIFMPLDSTGSGSMAPGSSVSGVKGKTSAAATIDVVAQHI